VTEEIAREIERTTRGQSSSPRWFKERKWRLTASKFGEIVKVTDKRDFQKFCESMYSPINLNTLAVSHGKTYEPIAIEKFEKKFHLKVQKCGLFINVNYPNFAASPDGLIDNNTIIEVKCPFAARHETITESENISFLEKNDQGNLIVKRSHNYYYQIQGQLLLAQKKVCHLIIYTFNDLQTLTVDFDESFVKSDLLPKLSNFYDTVYLPFLTTVI
jgi:hypothetical protein